MSKIVKKCKGCLGDALPNALYCAKCGPLILATFLKKIRTLSPKEESSDAQRR